MKNNEISVLMSTYFKEKPEYLEQALHSIWTNQSIKPSQIVLVKDGPLTAELETVIQKWKFKLSDVLEIVALPQNIGTGGAKSAGLKNCTGDFIAIVDTDDICLPNRFEEQLSFMMSNPDVDGCGTWISEMDASGNLTRDKVCYPTEHHELFKMFNKRDPIPHATFFFRRRFFEERGVKYLTDLKFAEDTLLWYQAFLKNCKLANIPVVTVMVRTDANLFYRRSDWEKSWKLLKARISMINRDLKYGIVADFYAICYFFMSQMPREDANKSLM